MNLAEQIQAQIAFNKVLPSIQTQLTNKDFALIDYFYLEPNSFLDRDKEFSVRCVFQIWCRRGLIDRPDLRLTKTPPIKHEDFEIWQYNATPSAMNTVEQDWSIAVYRQGHHDYNKRFSRDEYEYIKRCMTGEETGGKQQFFFIKPLTEQAKEIIDSMNFNALAERNTATPGFGKGDFVSYYIELKNIKGG